MYIDQSVKLYIFNITEMHVWRQYTYFPFDPIHDQDI